MSKRWWLPTQKGTELFPNVTVAPPKLVIEGVATGTPLYASIAERFNGRLKQFHGHCQQDYSLTNNEVMKRRISFGDEASATYVNMHGQETLTLRVSARVLEQEKHKPHDQWDYALIELFVPDMHYSDRALGLQTLAHLTGPTEAQLAPGMTWPVAGLAADFETRVTPDRMINAAESDDDTHTSAVTDEGRYASFLVDLRPAHGLSAVTVDLHALIRVAEEVLPPAFWFTPNGADTTNTEIPRHSPPGNELLTAADYDQLMDDVPNASVIYTPNETFSGGALPLILSTYNADFDIRGGFPDYPGALKVVGQSGIPDGPQIDVIYFSSLPEVVFDYNSHTYVFSATNTQLYNEYLGDRLLGTEPDLTPPLFAHVVELTGGWWRHWYIASDPSAYDNYTGPSPVPGEVQLTLFKGKPNVDVGEYTNPFDTAFFRWDFTDIFPARVGHMTLSQTTIPTFSNADTPFINDPGQLYGIPKLGTVVIMLQTDLGSSWQPA